MAAHKKSVSVTIAMDSMLFNAPHSAARSKTQIQVGCRVVTSGNNPTIFFGSFSSTAVLSFFVK